MDRNTQITMTSGKSHALSSSVEQIKEAIAGATIAHVTLIKVVDGTGHELWVNANQIETIQAYTYGSATT
jgi:uncharacterized protein YlzI (FlbEa/FlbD family)